LTMSGSLFERGPAMRRSSLVLSDVTHERSLSAS
jgi:hypothetical protein